MTSNQLKRYEVETRNRELQEQRRANLAREAENIRANKAQESLKNRENLAKYGAYDYATNDSAFDTSWVPLKTAKDTLSWILDPIYRLFGGKK